MVKYQKNDGVFTKIFGTDRQKHMFDIFLANGKKYSDENADLKEFTGIYHQLVEMNKGSLELLSKVEELIMQCRHLEDFKNSGTMKFSMAGRDNSYIYCYAKFYRHGYVRDELKEIVGKTEIYGDQVDKFSGNPDLMRRAASVLEKSMIENIRITRQQVNKLLENKFGNKQNSY